MRLFVAICLNDDVKSRLGVVIDHLKQIAVHGNFTRPENLHLTLNFIGETANLDAACRAVESVQTESFLLQMGGLGRFRREGGDIVWMGVESSSTLLAVQSRLTDALQRAGFSLETREYRPHLTLGRGVVLQNGWEMAEEIAVPSINMEVDRFSLMNSERIDGRLVYSEIYFLGNPL